MVRRGAAPGLARFPAEPERPAGAPDKDSVPVADHADRVDLAGHLEGNEVPSVSGPDFPIGDVPISELRGARRQVNVALLLARLQSERRSHGRHPSADSQGSATVAVAAAAELRSPNASAAAIQAASGISGRGRGRDVTRSVE